MRLILQRMEVEQPLHVWLSPQSSPFSPFQRSNQRNPTQKAALHEKRQKALREYVGATCIMHHAIQQGIHVTLELPDRSEAWRLPVLNRIQQKYGLQRAVVRGCALGLRDKLGEGLSGRDWRVLTTHKRLADSLHLPCQCKKGHQHGKSEEEPQKPQSRYPEALAKRVARVLLQELTHHDTVLECGGQSMLYPSPPKGFRTFPKRLLSEAATAVTRRATPFGSESFALLSLFPRPA